MENIQTELITNDHEFVNMGEAGIWAKQNVGTNGVPFRSYFFEWGETNEREKYGKENKYVKSGFFSDTQLKYSKKDGLTELAPEDDPAHVLWGGDWYTPTKEDFIRLFSTCKAEFLLGTLVLTAPNGNRLTFYAEGSKKGIAGEDGFEYWTSSLQTKREGVAMAYEFAYVLMVTPSTKINLQDVKSSIISSDLRTAGLPIRPIIRR